MATLARIVKSKFKISSNFLQTLQNGSFIVSGSGKVSVRAYASAVTESKTSKQPCLIYSSICLQRHAILDPPMNEIETTFANLQATVEEEYSKLSDHELRHQRDLVKAEKLKQGEEDLQDDEGEGYITAMDAEDSWDTELTNFTPGITSSTDTLTSVERKLDRKLFFIHKQKLGEQSQWMLPLTQIEEGETLRDTAERLVQLTVRDAKVEVIGNAPIGVYKYKFTENGQTTRVKVFFYRAELVDTFTNLSKLAATSEEFMWLTSEEMMEHLPKTYAKTVRRFLLDL